jgi:hypothetical protein
VRGSHLGIAGPLLALACSEPPPPGPAPFPPGPTERLTVPAAPRRAVDLLYVIDNAGSAGEAQWEVALSFGALVATLAHGLGTQPDLHVGVISTDLGTRGVYFGPCSPPGRPAGDDGALLTNGCAGIDGTFLRDVARADGGRDVNYTGALADRFSCMARLGTGGCLSFEAPLGAPRARSSRAQPGFLRPSATLAVVLVTNEDDCVHRPGVLRPGQHDARAAHVVPLLRVRRPLRPRRAAHVRHPRRLPRPRRLAVPAVGRHLRRAPARTTPRSARDRRGGRLRRGRRRAHGRGGPRHRERSVEPRLGYTCFGQAGWGLPPSASPTSSTRSAATPAGVRR